MSEIMKFAKNAEYEKMLTKRNRIHAKFKSRLENQDKHPEIKIIPECTRFPDGQLIPQYWVHFRLSPNDRIDYLKDLYKRFRWVSQQQEACRKNKVDQVWFEFPTELIEELYDYEFMPSDELLKIVISDEYRMPETGLTLDEEKRRLMVPEDVLNKSNWRYCGTKVHTLSDGTQITRATNYPDGTTVPELEWSDWDGPTLQQVLEQHAAEAAASSKEVILVDDSEAVDYNEEPDTEIAAPVQSDAEAEYSPSPVRSDAGDAEMLVDSDAATSPERKASPPGWRVPQPVVKSKVYLRGPDQSTSSDDSDYESGSSESSFSSTDTPKAKKQSAK